MTGISGKRLWWTLSLIVAAACAGVWFFAQDGKLGKAAAAPNTVQTVPSVPGRIASRGRIEPLDGIMHLSARSISGQPSIVGELHVKEGDWVRAGQVIAILDSHRQLEATVRDLEAQVEVARQRLAAVKMGGKKADTAAGEAEIARLQAVLADARQGADRYEDLYRKGSATITERDQRQLQVETTLQAINAAKARLAGVNEVRDADVDLAEEEVRAAQASVSRVEAELEASVVHAPSEGRVLKVDAHAGEEVGSQGLIELARTDRMCVIAEVYESDVSRVRAGQSATVSGDALKTPLRGTVVSIGTQVAKDSLTSIDPVSMTDARVVEVKILLNDHEEAARLIHAQVTAIIEP